MQESPHARAAQSASRTSVAVTPVKSNAVNRVMASHLASFPAPLASALRKPARASASGASAARDGKSRPARAPLSRGPLRSAPIARTPSSTSPLVSSRRRVDVVVAVATGASSSPDASSSPVASRRAELFTATKNQLRAAAKECGLPVGGSKTELVDRLVRAELGEGVVDAFCEEEDCATPLNVPVTGKRPVVNAGGEATEATDEATTEATDLNLKDFEKVAAAAAAAAAADVATEDPALAEKKKLAREAEEALFRLEEERKELEAAVKAKAEEREAREKAADDDAEAAAAAADAEAKLAAAAAQAQAAEQSAAEADVDAAAAEEAARLQRKAVAEQRAAAAAAILAQKESQLEDLAAASAEAEAAVGALESAPAAPEPELEPELEPEPSVHAEAPAATANAAELTEEERAAMDERERLAAEAYAAAAAKVEAAAAALTAMSADTSFDDDLADFANLASRAAAGEVQLPPPEAPPPPPPPAPTAPTAMKPPATSQFTPPRATHGATGSPAPMKAPPPPGALGSAPLPPQSPPTQQFGESPNWVKNRPGFPGGAPDHAGHQNPGEGGRVNAAGPANNDSLRKVGKVDLPAAGSGKADPNRVVNEDPNAAKNIQREPRSDPDAVERELESVSALPQTAPSWVTPIVAAETSAERNARLGASATGPNAAQRDVDARTRLGANVTSVGCAFGVWAPHAEQTKVVIYDPRGPIRHAMTRESPESPYFRCEIPDIVPGRRYSFEVTLPGGEGEVMRRDPWARQTDFDSDICTVVDPAEFSWTPFARVEPDKLVFYQAHVGTFTGRNDPDVSETAPGGTFNAMRNKLDHIAGMGFTAIQLLPTTEFGGAWGYNPRLMHSVHGPYGTPRDFANLVDAAHQRGIAVFVDLALHHGAANGNSLWEYDGWSVDNNGGIYFEGTGDTGWGTGFSFWKEEVQHYLASAAITWLADYNVDGVRVDSAHSMPPEMARRITDTIRGSFPDRFIVGEHMPESPDALHRMGFDANWMLTMCDDAASMSNSWKGDAGKLASLIVLRDGYGVNSQCVKYFMGSHDQCGKRPGHTHDLGHWAGRFGGHGDWRARATARMWWGAMCAGQGLPLMFMGTEIHQGGHWHVDLDTSFDWGLLHPDAIKDPDCHGHEGVACVAAANKMRATHPSLTSGGGKVIHQDAENGVVAVERHHEETNERCVVIVNAGDGQWDAESLYGINVGDPWDGFGGFVEIFNSQDEAFGGWPNSGNKERGFIEQDGKELKLAIPKLGVVVLKQTPPKPPGPDPEAVLAALNQSGAGNGKL
jgi:1,4-alpha-glucan branching enzyme